MGEVARTITNIDKIMNKLSRAYRDDMLISEYDKLVKKAQQAIKQLIEAKVREARLDELAYIDSKMEQYEYDWKNLKRDRRLELQSNQEGK